MIDPLPNHGGQLRQIAARFNLPASQLLDFSANINPEGPPPAVLPALRRALEDPATLTSYPDLDQLALREAIALYAGTTPENLAVANGFVPLLDATLRALHLRRCLLPVPAFVEYRPALTRANIQIIPHYLQPEDNFTYNLDALLSGDHDAILLANPQNPTGVGSSRQHLLELVTRAAERNITVLLDEAFIDYIPSASLTPFVDRFPNLIVFRSVTKFHAIPGLRVAYLAAAGSLISVIERQLPPWPVTTLAALAVIAALPDAAFADETRALNHQRRTLLHSELTGLGLRVYDSSANFLFFALDPAQDADLFSRRMILDHGIVLRTCFNYDNLSPSHFRTAIKTTAENARLVEAVRRTLALL